MKPGEAARFVDRDLSLLHPSCRDAFQELAVDLSDQHQKEYTNVMFRAFEGVRSPLRQRYLFAQEPQVTKSDAWQSAHNFGMAVDFVPFIYEDGQYKWSWDDRHPWDFLKARAAVFGLRVPISWDRGHVEAPQWADIRWALRNA